MFEKVNVLAPPLFLLGGGQLSVTNFEKGEIRKKMSAWGDLRSSCQIFAWEGLTMFPVKKTFKNKICL